MSGTVQASPSDKFLFLVLLSHVREWFLARNHAFASADRHHVGRSFPEKRCRTARRQAPIQIPSKTASVSCWRGRASAALVLIIRRLCRVGAPHRLITVDQHNGL